jgi:Flp pilus assembly protein TadG
MKLQKPLRKEARKNEQGSIMAMSAIGMLSFILAVGLAVDITRLYLTKNELQNAADAAALAGASGLNFTPTGIHDAADRVVAEMNKYQFNKTNVSFPRDKVRFAVNLNDFDSGADMNEGAAAAALVAPTIRFVKAETEESPVGISFAVMTLGSSQNLKAQAIAGLSAPLNIFTGYLPVAGTIGPGGTCQLIPGNTCTVRSEPSTSVSPGNYQVLAIDGSGANDDRTGLASAVKNVVGPGGYVDSKPGVNSGPVKQGINTRFDDYASGLDPNYYPPDKNIAENITYAQYLAGSPSQASSHPGIALANRRVVLVPLVQASEFAGGRTNVQIDHFGAFFLRNKVNGNGNVDLEYIGIGVVVGSGFYDPTAPANPGPSIVKPVLYR